MSGVRSEQRVIWLLLVLVMSLAVSACGSNDTEVNDANLESTAAVSTPTSSPAEESSEEDSGGVIRTIRNAPGAVWDGVTSVGSWIWGGVSSGGNAIWNAIKSAYGFFWDGVTGLAGSGWNAIKSYWERVKGSDLGQAAAQLPELIGNLNPAGWIESLIGALVGFLVNLLKAVLLLVLVVTLVFGFFKFGVWKHANRIFWGRLEHRLARVPTQVNRKPNLGKPAPTPTNQGIQAGSERIARADSPSRGSDEVEVAALAPSQPMNELLWSREQIRELRERVTNETIITLFGLASARDGEPVNYLELMRATGRSGAQVRADFSGFSRIARSIHSDESWPINRISPTDGKSSQAYEIPEQYLEWWFEK